MSGMLLLNFKVIHGLLRQYTYLYGSLKICHASTAYTVHKQRQTHRSAHRAARLVINRTCQTRLTEAVAAWRGHWLHAYRAEVGCTFASQRYMNNSMHIPSHTGECRNTGVHISSCAHECMGSACAYLGDALLRKQ
jgi:hypothetical protein